MSEQDHLSHFIGLYKFYWDLAIKLCMFFLGASGAVSAYVIKNQDIEYMGLALLIPIVMCVFGARLTHTSLPGLTFMRHEVIRLSQELKQQSYPEFKSLISFVSALRILFSLIAIGMIGLWSLIGCSS